jgi:hypothetical protein
MLWGKAGLLTPAICECWQPKALGGLWPGRHDAGIGRAIVAPEYDIRAWRTTPVGLDEEADLVLMGRAVGELWR